MAGAYLSDIRLLNEALATAVRCKRRFMENPAR